MRYQHSKQDRSIKIRVRLGMLGKHGHVLKAHLKESNNFWLHFGKVFFRGVTHTRDHS